MAVCPTSLQQEVRKKAFVLVCVFASGVCNRRSENVGIHAVVVAELEFCNVKRQVFLADLVVGADNPALEDRPKSFDGVRVDGTYHILPATMPNILMWEVRPKVAIAGMLVRGQKAHLVGNGGADEAVKSCGIRPFNHASNGVPFALNGANDDEFVAGLTPNPAGFLVPMAVLIFTADERFIDLYNSAEFVHVGINKSGPDTVAHVVRSLVGAETHDAHDLQSRDAFFAGQHHMCDAEPVTKRLVGVFKDRSCQVREAIAVFGAVFALPMMTGRKSIDMLIATPRAPNTIRPPTRDQVCNAGFFVRKSLFKLRDCHLGDGLGLLRTGHGGSSMNVRIQCHV